jgi:nucleoside-diphosphate-sugar epimerase
VIVGRGLLAQAFSRIHVHDPDVTIFVSGVSNSLEVRAEAFARERDLLASVLGRQTRRIVYFSCCSLSGSGAGTATPYMRHKLEMESRIRAVPGGMVMRLPQVVGRSGNPHTLANYLHAKITSGEPFEVWRHAERNLIDAEDVAAIATAMIGDPDATRTLRTIATPYSLGMLEIVSIFERVLARDANFTVVDKGHALPVDATEAVAIAAQLGIAFDQDYPERLLRKYHGRNAACRVPAAD